MNKVYNNMNIDCWAREFVLFVIHLNLGQQSADYRGKASTYSGQL